MQATRAVDLAADTTVLRPCSIVEYNDLTICPAEPSMLLRIEPHRPAFAEISEIIVPAAEGPYCASVLAIDKSYMTKTSRPNEIISVVLVTLEGMSSPAGSTTSIDPKGAVDLTFVTLLMW